MDLNPSKPDAVVERLRITEARRERLAAIAARMASVEADRAERQRKLAQTAEDESDVA